MTSRTSSSSSGRPVLIRMIERAAAMASAIAVTAVIISVIAEIGHPPSSGITLLSQGINFTSGHGSSI